MIEHWETKHRHRERRTSGPGPRLGGVAAVTLASSGGSEGDGKNAAVATGQKAPPADCSPERAGAKKALSRSMNFNTPTLLALA